MPPIHIMIKPVSGLCNMHCKYCFYADEASHRTLASYGIMQSDTVHSLIRKAFLYADDSITFSFQGGEPTLAGLDFYSDFIKTVNEYNSRKIRIFYNLQTNAFTLTDEMCSFFAKNSFLIGVSLDGTQKIHDSLRIDYEQNGTYERVSKSIALLKKHNVQFNILCVITKGIVDNIGEVWKELSKFEHIQFIPCIDGLDGIHMPYSIDEDSYGRFLVNLFDLYKTAFFTSMPVRERRMDNYISMLLGYPPEHCGMAGECGLYFLCEADGSVFPCDFYVLDKWKLGNINESSFLRMSKNDIMKQFQEEGRTLPQECKECKYFYLCHGGCRRDREPTLLTNRFCKSYKYFFDNRIEELKKLAKEIK